MSAPRIARMAACSLILAGCYQTHQPPESDTSGARATDAGVWTGDAGHAGGFLGDAGPVVPPLDAGADAGANAVDGGSPGDSGHELGPLLLRADPGEACSNRGQWVTLRGSGIHWQASVRIRYPYSGAEVTVAPGLGVDGEPALDWQDTAAIAVWVATELPWVPEPVPGSLPAGHYLAGVVNPDGQVSNEVDVVLGWCP